MPSNENHVSMLYQAFKEDPLFLHLFPPDKIHKQSKALIRFILKQNRLSDGLMLTDHNENPSYLALIDRPKHLRKQSLGMRVRLGIEMLFLGFYLPFSVLRFLSAYQKETLSAAAKEPHYYLSMLGVAPSSQGKGIGKKVLREIHAMAESSPNPFPISLDTENIENIPYYEGMGYKLTATKVIRGLKIYCMTRSR